MKIVLGGNTEMSALLTETMAMEAIDMTAAIVAEMRRREILASEDCHMVVLDPLTGEILAEKSFGDVAGWRLRFDEIARSKAAMTRRTGVASRDIQVRSPFLLQPGDTVWYGAAIADNLVVAVSGYKQEQDEAISEICLSLCRMLSITRRKLLSGGVIPDATH